jgi:hypothetical protein
MTKRIGAVLVAGLLVLALTCTSGSDVAGDRRVVGGVAVAFTARPARVEVGRPVRLALRLTNVGGTGKQLTFPTSQEYDFWVVRGDDEIWRWSEDRVFTQAVQRRELPAQQTITLSELWVADTAGTYVVHGEVMADGYGRDLTGRVRVGD